MHCAAVFCGAKEIAGELHRSPARPAARIILPWRFLYLRRALAETQLIKMPAQSLDAFLPRESDGADRKPELRGDLRIRSRRCFEKQQLHQAPALRC